jgi:cobalt-zinc-cadmium efflux system outer membrane protein
LLEMRQTVLAATDASDLLARRLRDAGNITELQRAQERAQHEQAKLDLAAAEVQVLSSRERLNELMGLWGEDTTWRVAQRLPDVPPAEIEVGAVEQTAIARSLDLAEARQRIVQSARRYGLRRSFSLVNDAEIGASAERETEGEWLVGPAFSLPIPLFNQGQASTATAQAELRRARSQYLALAAKIRSRARAARERLIAARARADYFRNVMLPLRHQIVEESQRQFNAMSISPFELLRAKQEEIEAGAQYIDALRDYWLARARVETLLNGRLTGGQGPTMSRPAQGSGSQSQGGH